MAKRVIEPGQRQLDTEVDQSGSRCMWTFAPTAAIARRSRSKYLLRACNIPCWRRARLVFMATNPKHPPGPPMDLANMRAQGVHHLIAFCHNDACRHQAVIDVSSYPR